MAHHHKKDKPSLAERNEHDARRAILEDLFYDFHRSRKQVYWMNFVRGVFFGFGSLLGGTIVVAIIVWILSQVTGFFPPLKEAVDALGMTMHQPRG